MTILLVSTIALALLVAFINGAIGSGGVVGLTTPVTRRGHKILYLASATLIASGGVMLGTRVSRTVARGVVDTSGLGVGELLIISLSTLISTLSASLAVMHYKIPISMSQLTVGGVIGAALALRGPSSIIPERLWLILASWVLTPVISGLLAASLNSAMNHISGSGSPRGTVILQSLIFFTVFFIVQYLLLSELVEHSIALVYSLFFSFSVALAIGVSMLTQGYTLTDGVGVYKLYTQAIATLLLGVSYGAHDVANSAGPLALVLSSSAQDFESSLKLAVFVASTGLFAGALLWSYRIAESVGGRIVTLTPETSFIVQVSSTLAILLAVGLRIPSSITLAITGSLAGLGYARGLKYVNTKMLIAVNLSWLILVPATCALSYAIATLMSLVV